MYMTLKHIIPITITAASAPTSNATKATKDKFYNTFKKEATTFKNNILHILGDFNARIQIKLGPHEECIGEHTFDKKNITHIESVVHSFKISKKQRSREACDP